ncbi:MAG: hypothetical protein K2I60_00230 [Oscillospiraceae bacterium]|nr:hypothetical protein [Oscillospiraceae bacterium]
MPLHLEHDQSMLWFLILLLLCYSQFVEGWGDFTPAKDVKKHHVGDIMSGEGHVYICIGECDDGSIVIVHSSPCGVQINGTTTKMVKKIV